MPCVSHMLLLDRAILDFVDKRVLLLITDEKSTFIRRLSSDTHLLSFYKTYLMLWPAMCKPRYAHTRTHTHTQTQTFCLLMREKTAA